MSDWNARVVASLMASKAVNVPFHEAWARAIKANPPRDRGETQLVLLDPDAETDQVTFMRRVCDDAYHGYHPELRHFTFALAIDVDDTRLAHKTGHIRAA